MRKLTLTLLASLFATSLLTQQAFAMPEPLEPEPQAPQPQHWRLPLDGGRVSSFFGAVRGRRAHGGIDFSVPSGTPVMATSDGTVVASTNAYKGDRKYGNVVVIEHEDGLRSLYAHLNKRNVNVGETVTAGELIGLSGSTGHSTGPHLHLEAFRNEARIDPNDLLLANLDDMALPSAMHTKRLSADEIVTTKAPSGKGGKSKAKSRGKERDKTTRLASKSRKTQVAQKPSKSRKHA